MTLMKPRAALHRAGKSRRMISGEPTQVGSGEIDPRSSVRQLVTEKSPAHPRERSNEREGIFPSEEATSS